VSSFFEAIHFGGGKFSGDCGALGLHLRILGYSGHGILKLKLPAGAKCILAETR
jgi:hypothetical protein